jgi:sulfoacetaldehyde acetyltransferase
MDYWPKSVKIIQVDADPEMLGLVKKISVGICGDAKAAAEALSSGSNRRSWAAPPTATAGSPRSRKRRPSGKRSLPAGITSAILIASI